MKRRGDARWLLLCALALVGCGGERIAVVTVDAAGDSRAQTIDGFGSSLPGAPALEPYFSRLLFEDLRASILRFDLTPRFKPPYSDFLYGSPGAPGNEALPGAEGNNVRTYRDAESYTRRRAGHTAQIAVMGPDVDRNLSYFDYTEVRARAAGLLAQQGARRAQELGDFKLIATTWSPAPWLKLASGDAIHGFTGERPADGTPWPFIWKGNFAGGVLDTSGAPRPQFDDSALGGSGPTSALTQFARGLAAYVRGFQRAYGVRLYALSIQNEPAFEQRYDSCAYRRAADYRTALAAARAELDRYDDLRSIRLFGPEDVLGGEAYDLWQEGSGETAAARNLRYLREGVDQRSVGRLLDLLALHGYAADGVGPSTARDTLWAQWWNGWRSSPARGLPDEVQGAASYGKRSWVTETSGEQPLWLAPSRGFPGAGALGIAIKLHQALTAGRQSAWLYWQLADGNDASAYVLTDARLRERSPKYVAAKHFFRFIRPGAVRVRAEVRGAPALLASAYVHDSDRALTIVLVNTSAHPVRATLRLPPSPALERLDAYSSQDQRYFEHATRQVVRDALQVTAPGYGVVTLHGQATR